MGKIKVKIPISQKKVSVIIGTKDRCLLVGRAISSIIDQTYQNWECIIIDCNSNDETKNIITSFIDDRIRYIKLNEDPGRAESLNIGIHISTGDYITFLDDDDEFLPTKLEDQVVILNNSTKEVGLSYCWAEFYDDNLNEVISVVKNDIQGNVIEYTLEKMSLCSAPALMFKRDALLSVNGIIDRVGFPSDWQLVCRLAVSFQVLLVPKVNVRVHKNHIYEQMSKPQVKTKAYYSIISDWHIDFLHEFKILYGQYPQKKLVHIYPLISSLILTGRVCSGIKYFFIAIYLKPISFIPIRRLSSGFYSLIKNDFS